MDKYAHQPAEPGGDGGAAVRRAEPVHLPADQPGGAEVLDPRPDCRCSREQLLWGKFAFAATGSLLVAEALILRQRRAARACRGRRCCVHAVDGGGDRGGPERAERRPGAYMPNFRETDPSKIVVGLRRHGEHGGGAAVPGGQVGVMAAPVHAAGLPAGCGTRAATRTCRGGCSPACRSGWWRAARRVAAAPRRGAIAAGHGVLTGGTVHAHRACDRGDVGLPRIVTRSTPEPIRRATADLGQPTNAEVQFADGSSLKLKLLDETIELVTPYGPLKIPVRAIRKIDFGMRLTETETKEIDAAVADLIGTNPAKRETAKAA